MRCCCRYKIALNRDVISSACAAPLDPKLRNALCSQFSQNHAYTAYNECAAPNFITAFVHYTTLLLQVPQRGRDRSDEPELGLPAAGGREVECVGRVEDGGGSDRGGFVQFFEGERR